MTAKNYAEATGVRARSDLSPNARTHASERLTDPELIKVADWLMQQIHKADNRGSTHVFVPIGVSRRLVDTILELVNRGGSAHGP